MKRFLCILCLLLAILCVFAACNDEEEPGTGNNNNENTEQSGGDNSQGGEQGGGEHTHFFGMWKVTTPATCTVEGEEKRTCSCGAAETREIAMPAHTYGEWSITAPATCAAVGEEKRACACGAEEKKEIPATGKHAFGEWEAITKETCVASGEYKRVCACGAAESKTVSATGKHEYGVENTCVVCEAEMVYTKELLYELSEDGRGYMVTGLAASGVTSVIIPPYHQKTPVVGIQTHAFVSLKELSEISFPDSLKVVKKDAFYDCPALIDVDNGISYVGKWVVGCETRVKDATTLHANVIGIGDGAFYGCTALEKITLPATLTHVGYKAFYGCTALSWITLPEGLKEIEDYAFEKCAALMTVKIPKSVTQIGKAPFKGCANLTSLVVENGNSLYHSAENCLIETQSKLLITGLNNAVIPADGSVTGIATEAFADCATLRTLSLPTCIAGIGENAFQGCTALQYTEHEGGKYLGNTENPHMYLAFVSDKTVTSFVIADTTTFIAREAFMDCLALASIHIPASVVEIGDRAFRHCLALSSVSFGENSLLRTIGEEAFQGCRELKRVIIPAAVTSIGRNAFMDCDAVDEVIFEESEGWKAVLGDLVKEFDDVSGDSAVRYLTWGATLSGYGEYHWSRITE